jgi:hypothetical protein
MLQACVVKSKVPPRAPPGLARVAALVLATAAAGAHAQADQSIEGWGRVTVLGGYRWVPNWYFEGKAAAAGDPVLRPSQGGPAVIGSFGYGATDWLEISVDLFGSYDSFGLQRSGLFSAFTYGAVLGPRLSRANLFFRGFTPFLGAEAGATFALVSSAAVNAGERLLPGFTAVAGFHLRIADRWALTFDARWIYARSVIPGISGLNVGGVLVSVGITAFFPPRPQELQAPGFGAPSHL